MMLMMLAKGASIISIIEGSFLQSELFPSENPLKLAKIGARAQRGVGVSFSKTSVLMMLSGGSRKTKKFPQQSIRAVRICFRNACQFELGLGVGCRRPPWRNGGPMMQGRRH